MNTLEYIETNEDQEEAGEILGPVEYSDNEEDQHNAEPPAKPLEAKRTMNLRSIINTPWILMAVPLIVVGVWVATNTWIITDNLDKPYALLAGPATLGSVFVFWLVIAFFRTIAAWCKSSWQSFNTWKRKDGSSFWMVVYTFLIISVLESGTFFNILLGPNSLHDALGYAISFGIDLVSVESVRARQGAVRLRDRKGERIHQLGVFVCALISAFANGYTALLHWHDPTNTAIPEFMIRTAPFIGVVFPLLMIFLSFASDYTADRSNAHLDPATFEKAERTRVQLLEIQRDGLKDRVRIEEEIDGLYSKTKQKQRVFFLKNWLFPQGLNMQEAKDQLGKEYRDHIDALYAQVTTLTKVFQEAQKALPGTLESLSSSISTQFVEAMQQNNQQYRRDIEGESKAIRELFFTQIDQLQGVLSVSISKEISSAKEEMIRHNINHTKDALKSLKKAKSIDAIQRQISTDIEGDIAPISETKEEDRQEQKPLDIEMTPALKALIDKYTVVERWIRTGQTSVSMQEIIDATNLSPQLVGRRANSKEFARTARPGVYRTKSVINWLILEVISPSKRTSKRQRNTDELRAIPKVVVATKENEELTT